MRSLQIRDKRKTGIPGSFKYESALCNFNFFRLVSIHSILHLRRGRFTTKAKLSALLSSVLCTGLIFFPLRPPPKQLAYCKANGCRLTNSKRKPELEAKTPCVLQKQQSILLRGITAIIWGPGLCLLAAPRTDLCLHRVLCKTRQVSCPQRTWNVCCFLFYIAPKGRERN